MPFKDEIDKLIKEGKVGQAMKLESKRQLQAMGRTGGAPNIMSLMGVLARARKNAPDKDEPEKEDPPLPPLADNGVDYASGRPKSNSWTDIVAFNFPKGAGKQYKDGGLVRGGGCAAKGRGRGRIV